MTNEHVLLPFGDGPGGRPITMRGPADMAEVLPYLLGFYPDDSIVAVGLQPPGLHQGGVIRLDIPETAEEWPAAAEETAGLLVRLSERQERRPVQVLLYLCREPAGPGPGGEHGPPVAAALRPLAERLREAFESRGVRVKESLCVSAGRWWSFLCTREGCCDPVGHPIHRVPGPGPVAVAATVAGLAPRGSRKEILAGLAPVGPPGARAARAALVRAGAGPSPGRPLSLDRRESTELLDTAVARFAAGATELDEDRTARLLLALQDRIVRDRAAEYARPAELAPAQRLWRFLATRCVPPYESFAAPPLTLLAWTSWVAGDTATARVVLGHTLRRNPSYLLAQLLYESLNGGFSPETLLVRVEEERRRRTERERAAADGPAAGADGGSDGGGERRPGPAAPSAPSARPAVPAPRAAVDGDGGAGEAPGRGRPGGPGGPAGTAGSGTRRRGRRRRGHPAEEPGAPPGGAGPERAPDGSTEPDGPNGTPPVRDGSESSGSSGSSGGSGGGTGAATARCRSAAAGPGPGGAGRFGEGRAGERRAEERRKVLHRVRIAHSSPWRRGARGGRPPRGGAPGLPGGAGGPGARTTSRPGPPPRGGR
ncbi:DUF4192 domain-containing protein, partial [Kitasatospora sp. NPDC056327]|uniref:DUF4192 domain-containing protein n=1 Tax=Kitasatospora sp. NPDC056327 TaxID=3345785 RepID=UPI0035DC45F0